MSFHDLGIPASTATVTVKAFDTAADLSNDARGFIFDFCGSTTLPQPLAA
jgi:hypothetical protein